MVLKNAWIHDGLGGVFRGCVEIIDGKISAVAENIDGEGEDFSGAHLLPGFIDPYTCWGINGSMTEIRPSSEDNDELSDPVTPELDVRYALNGRAMSVQQLGLYGITAVGVTPTDNNVFGGQAVAAVTDGLNPFKMILKTGVAMKASVSREVKLRYGKRNMPPMTKMRIFQLFESNLRQAAEYQPAEDGAGRNEKLAALKRVIDGEMPLWISADSAEERQRVMEILAPYDKVRVVFCQDCGLDESDADFDPEKTAFISGYYPMDMDPRYRNRNYGALEKVIQAGIPVAVSGRTGAMYGRETQLWHAFELSRTVKDPEQLIRMMTSVPAALMGIDDITGSVQPGKRADITLWTENPICSFQARVIRCMAGGRTIYAEGDVRKCYV